MAWDSPYVRRQLLEFAATSAGQYNVGLGALNRVRIPIPPAIIQVKILDTVEMIRSRARLLLQSCADSAARSGRLRNAVLRRAFSGTLGVTETRTHG